MQWLLRLEKKRLRPIAKSQRSNMFGEQGKREMIKNKTSQKLIGISLGLLEQTRETLRNYVPLPQYTFCGMIIAFLVGVILGGFSVGF